VRKLHHWLPSDVVQQPNLCCKTSIHKPFIQNLSHNAKTCTVRHILVWCSQLCNRLKTKVAPIWHKEELSQQWKDFITVSSYKIENKIACNNLKWTSLSVSQKLLATILLAQLTPFVNKIIVEYQSRFYHNMWTVQFFIIWHTEV
jgi:hypothetical protein